MRTVALCCLLALVALAAEARGKPISFVVDQELKQAWGVFEATAVVKGTQITVEVTRDPDRIYRGVRWLGKSLDLRFWYGARRSGSRWLDGRKGAPTLLVIGKNKEIRLVGERCKAGYRFRGFFDYNGVWLRSKQGFGRVISNERWTIDAPMEVTHRALGTVFVAEQHKVQRRAAILLMCAPEERSAEHIRWLIARLGSRTYRTREAAQARLSRVAVFELALVRAQARSHPDLEVRRRLRQLLEPIAIWERALALARKAARDPALKKKILATYRLTTPR